MSYDRVITLRPDTASNWSTNNPVLAQGEGAIEIDTGYIKIGDGTSSYNNLGYITPIVSTYDLTSSNQTHTFPKVTMKGQVCDVFWTNGGTYKLSFAVSNSETIGGETASTWEGEGEGHIRVISDGSNWQVVEYRDYDSWHEVGASGEPAYQNGWGYQAGQPHLKFRWVKIDVPTYRRIEFDGAVHDFSGAGDIIFTFPSTKYYSTTEGHHQIASHFTGSTRSYTEVSVDTSGNVRSMAYGSLSDTKFNGLSYIIWIS